MTKEQAEHLAKHDASYRARKLKGNWVVWHDAGDHVVEFSQAYLNVVLPNMVPDAA